jgi:nicotinamide riboside transporter PnuC
MSFTQTIGEKMANIPYNYRLGLIEATNYVLEIYQIKFLGKYVLFKHEKNGSHQLPSP